MSENSVKGGLFNNVLAMVAKKWGRESLEKIGRQADQYKGDEWYPLSDFESLLYDIDGQLGKGDNTSLSGLAYEMVMNNFQFRTIFTNRDPKYVFLSTKQQDARYSGGKFDTIHVRGSQIRIEVSDWATEPIWYEFFKGRLQGVLELTGHLGTVELTIAGNKFIYDIFWQ
jgi:hypothetical protein